MRTIKSIHKSQKVNMGGILLDQPLPVGDLQSVDPFLLIHHWKQVLPGDQRQRDVGVGPHPHRGFSPVTVIFDGSVHHRDSMGNDSIVHAGGTQWMVAGKGITHSERPSQDLAQTGGAFEFIQFWVNLPAKHKMDVPIYHALQREETPTWTSAGVEARVISGEFNNVSGGIHTPHDITVVALEMEEGSSVQFDLPVDEKGVLYQLDGAISVQGGHTSYAKTLYEFDSDDQDATTHIEAQASTRLLLLHGKPLSEKVAQYGPFVMNSQTEIMQALRDAQMGKMGVLIEEF